MKQALMLIFAFVMPLYAQVKDKDVEVIFEKTLANAGVIRVFFSRSSGHPGKAAAYLKDKEYLNKLPPGTRVIVPDWLHEYSFLYFSKGSSQPKEIWKMNEEGLSARNEMKIFDAKITVSETLVLVYSHMGNVCGDVIENDGRLPYEARYLFNENEVTGKAVKSAEISGSPEQNDLTVVIKLYDGETLVFSRKNSIWVNESTKN
jgi:hypothetical protein